MSSNDIAEQIEKSDVERFRFLVFGLADTYNMINSTGTRYLKECLSEYANYKDEDRKDFDDSEKPDFEYVKPSGGYSADESGNIFEGGPLDVSEIDWDNL